MPRTALRRNDIARYKRFDPHRLPRWRYDRIRSILDANEAGQRERPHRDEDDEFVINGYSFLRRWEQINQYDLDPDRLERQRQLELFGVNPGLYYAYQLYNAAKDDITRNHIEAHILSGRPDTEIADMVDQMPETIDWYERLFFNVRSKLKNKTYIDSQVLAKAVNCGLAQLDLKLMLKFWGYYGGPIMLDAYMHGLPSNFVKPGPNTDLKTVFVDIHRYDVLKFMSSATKAIGAGDINTFNYFEMCNAHNQIVAAIKEAKEGDRGSFTPIEETLSAVLTGLDWVVGASRKQALRDSPLSPFLGHAAEPRADDQLRIAAGLPVEYTAEDVAALKLPPLRKKKVTNDAETTE